MKKNILLLAIFSFALNLHAEECYVEKDNQKILEIKGFEKTDGQSLASSADKKYQLQIMNYNFKNHVPLKDRIFFLVGGWINMGPTRFSIQLTEKESNKVLVSDSYGYDDNLMTAASGYIAPLNERAKNEINYYITRGPGNSAIGLSGSEKSDEWLQRIVEFTRHPGSDDRKGKYTSVKDVVSSDGSKLKLVCQHVHKNESIYMVIKHQAKDSLEAKWITDEITKNAASTKPAIIRKLVADTTKAGK